MREAGHGKVRATHEKIPIVEERVDVLHVASGKNKSITRLDNVVKVSPNILTLTDAASRGQKVGDSDFATLFHSVSRRPIHCSALTAVNARKLLRARNHFPHGPNRFALHFVRRRGIPRTSRCKKECSCPSIGKCTKSVAGPRVADTA